MHDSLHLWHEATSLLTIFLHWKFRTCPLPKSTQIIASECWVNLTWWTIAYILASLPFGNWWVCRYCDITWYMIIQFRSSSFRGIFRSVIIFVYELQWRDDTIFLGLYQYIRIISICLVLYHSVLWRILKIRAKPYMDWHRMWLGFENTPLCFSIWKAKAVGTVLYNIVGLILSRMWRRVNVSNWTMKGIW